MTVVIVCVVYMVSTDREMDQDDEIDCILSGEDLNWTL